MEGQRIYLDENENLVVETNNGRQDASGASIKIEGDFTVSAEDVVKLLGIVNDTYYSYPVIKKFDISNNPFFKEYEVFHTLMTNDFCLQRSLERNESLCQEVRELKDKIEELKRSLPWWRRILKKY
jgi:tRNA uridine 5-carbamoylmethylation protein Kti12